MRYIVKITFRAETGDFLIEGEGHGIPWKRAVTEEVLLDALRGDTLFVMRIHRFGTPVAVEETAVAA